MSHIVSYQEWSARQDSSLYISCHDLKPIITWYPKAIGTSVTCYLRFIATPHKETRGVIKSKTKHRIIIQPHQVLGKQNAGKYTKYPPIPSLTSPFTLLQSPPTQPTPNRIPSVTIKGAHLFGRVRGSKTPQIRGDGIVPCGSQGCQLCSPGIPEMMKCVFFVPLEIGWCKRCFSCFTFFNELKY